MNRGNEETSRNTLDRYFNSTYSLCGKRGAKAQTKGGQEEVKSENALWMDMIKKQKKTPQISDPCHNLQKNPKTTCHERTIIIPFLKRAHPSISNLQL